jgi:hypothetical protein
MEYYHQQQEDVSVAAFVEVELEPGEDNNTSSSKTRRKSWKRRPFAGTSSSSTTTKQQPKPKELLLLPLIVVDEDSSQADILKQTLARKKQGSFRGRISGILSSPTDGKGHNNKIDVQEFKRLQELSEQSPSSSLLENHSRQCRKSI